MSSFFLSTASFITLLMIASGVTYIARFLKIPSTVLLVGVGIFVALLSKISIFSFIDDFELTSNILFYVFLPILLFESAYSISYKDLLRNIRSISVLSVFSLVISAFVIAGLIYYIFAWIGFPIPFLIALLFGSLISATDTAAALSIFKNLGVPRRLNLIFEGESLFNDGTAIALFLVVLGVVGSHSISKGFEHENLYSMFMHSLEGGMGAYFPVINGIVSMGSMIMFGIIIGATIGIIFSKIIQRIQNDSYLEITLSLVLAHATFLIAEGINEVFIPVSGIIATVAAAMVLGNYGRAKISPHVEEVMEKYWGLFTFVSNSLIFILVGMLIVNLDVDWQPLILPILVTIPVVLLSRAVSVYPLLSFLNWTKKEEYIPTSWQHVLAWGALRGGVAVMLLFLIPADTSLHGWAYHHLTIREFLTSLTIGVVVFSIFVNTLAIAPMIRYFKIDALRDIEELEYVETRIFMTITVLQKLSKIRKGRYIDAEEGELLAERYQKDINTLEKELKELEEKYSGKFGSLVRRVTALHALAIERHELVNLYKQNQLPEKVFKRIMNRLVLQIRRVDKGESQLDNIRYIRPRKDVFERVSQYVLEHIESPIDPIHESYYEVRTLHIITEKALEHLKSLSQIAAIARRKEFHEVIELYDMFFRESEQKRRELFRTHRDVLRKISAMLTEKSLLSAQNDILDDMKDKKIISPKLASRF